MKHVPDSPKRNAPQALVSGKKYIPRYYKIRYFIVQSRSQQGAESLVIYITQKKKTINILIYKCNKQSTNKQFAEFRLVHKY